MHRLATTPGGWSPGQDGVVFVEQTPAPIVILTAADTDTQTLAIALQNLPQDFPAIRVANLLNLQQELAIDTYAETVLAHAQVIVLRLLGGRSYWSYGLEVCKSLVADYLPLAQEKREREKEKKLVVLSGDDSFDPDLVSHSNVPLRVVHRLWCYFLNGGADNAIAALQFLADTYFDTNYQPQALQAIPKIGLYKGYGSFIGKVRSAEYEVPSTKYRVRSTTYKAHPRAGILFYRAHYLAGNLAPIDALCQALFDRGITPVPVFIYSLQDPDLEMELEKYFGSDRFLGIEAQRVDPHPTPHTPHPTIDILLNTTSFSLSKPGAEDKGDIWRSLNVPVLQIIFSSSTVAQWQVNSLGLSPRDVAMNVALPEVDGRIITRAVSFKSVAAKDPRLETDIVVYEPICDRIDFVADLAAKWIELRRTPVSDRRIALILANYPTRNGRLANGVGLDTPASCINILKAMQATGYRVGDIPRDGDELIRQLTRGVTNDPESQALRAEYQLTSAQYREFFDSLPVEVRDSVCQRWGDPQSSPFIVPGIQFGNVFVGIQPSRGYDRDPSLNYHAPDLEPTHDYLAFYCWLRREFQVHAIAHIGKHGNLEWLPGKGLALSQSCFPEVGLGAIPHLYPFIVNDPGEGTQAKRRASAVIIDHLTPPMTRAETYGNLQKIEHLIDEYHEAQSLDPGRTRPIRQKILELVEQENLQHDLDLQKAKGKIKDIERESLGIQGSRSTTSNDWEESSNSELSIVNSLDGYLCELKEAQIRDGLHIFGECPTGRQLRDLLVAIARNPGNGKLGITQILVREFALDFDPLTADPSAPFTTLPEPLQKYLDGKCHIVGDALAALENCAADLTERLLEKLDSFEGELFSRGNEGKLIASLLLPIHVSLKQTDREIINFLRGLNGEYIPSGASGAPTRGRADVLPTGKNFYSVDIRSIPTETAWDVGRRSAEILVETYTQEHGEYPRSLGLSVWGTSTMRTGGDDIAEALSLIGVQPVWDGLSRRVVDFDILPLNVLGRPRVDVMLRISGFFRDGFANLIDLFQQAVERVSQLDEPDDMNPLKAQIGRDMQALQQQGLALEPARATATYRVFGSKPGAYGAGLQGLIESQNWQSDTDLAAAYINWSSYAYTGCGEAHTAPEALKQRLSQLQIVLHNQDNREHDLVDSDDYYQFQGGMAVSVRSLTGKNPQTYFGDRSRPQDPKVRSLEAEISRVYRSRVINPKWIEGMMRHGYKGAFEMAATVDYLFAYDATANCVADFMYEGVANAYLFDPKVQEFISDKNPWALRDMAERLLEAYQRGLWQNISDRMQQDLRSLVLSAEAEIESLQ